MNKELLLLRHGKSDWSKNYDDFHRPLKARGRRGAEKVGYWLRQQQLQPDLIMSSPATRARATAIIAAKALGYPEQQIIFDNRIYAAEIKTLKKILVACPDTLMRVLLVGHNPELEDLLLNLSDTPITLPEDGKLMATATLARLKIPESWKNLKSGCARVLSINRAKSLPDSIVK